jgi:glutamate synthase (NADPH/NADH) large chain/glutamate synthase (ferredoxin)
VKDDPTAVRYATRDRNDPEHDQPIDDIILQDAEEAIRDAKPVSLSYKVDNTNRSIATKVSGEIGYQYGEEGLPKGTVELKLTGTAGQSLGAFLAPGIRLILTGEANDYVGKTMSGGEIVIRPLPGHQFKPENNSILGNTVMYGATGGYLFANGRAGERFCVRNSGGTAVVEAIGDHGCEYMTGGTVVVLGTTGKNFGAGMTGGIAFIFDEENKFLGRYNDQLVGAERLTGAEEEAPLRMLIEKHLEETGSPLAARILTDWEGSLASFWKVTPRIPVAKPIEEKKSDEDAGKTIITEAITAIKGA